MAAALPFDCAQDKKTAALHEHLTPKPETKTEDARLPGAARRDPQTGKGGRYKSSDCGAT
jgi:hypothetical protein